MRLVCWSDVDEALRWRTELQALLRHRPRTAASRRGGGVAKPPVLRRGLVAWVWPSSTIDRAAGRARGTQGARRTSGRWARDAPGSALWVSGARAAKPGTPRSRSSHSVTDSPRMGFVVERHPSAVAVGTDTTAAPIAFVVTRIIRSRRCPCSAQLRVDQPAPRRRTWRGRAW